MKKKPKAADDLPRFSSVLSETDNILQEARTLTASPRAAAYGSKRENHDNIARLWSAYLDYPINMEQVAIMMALLKIARTKTGKVRDNFVDGAAYIAIAGELEVE